MRAANGMFMVILTVRSGRDAEPTTVIGPDGRVWEEYPATSMFDHEEAVQQPEGHRRHAFPGCPSLYLNVLNPAGAQIASNAMCGSTGGVAFV